VAGRLEQLLISSIRERSVPVAFSMAVAALAPLQAVGVTRSLHYVHWAAMMFRNQRRGTSRFRVVQNGSLAQQQVNTMIFISTAGFIN
jgi:hypothetical protein